MGPQEVQALLDAGKEMVGERRLIGTDGYADSQEIEVFIGAILPARLRDRIINRFPDEKTRLFAIACLLGVVGIFAGAIMSRARRVAPAD
jgi:hypothetical protein